MRSKRIIRRLVLDHVARALLVRLLAPYADFFAARGVSLDELAATAQDDRRLVRRVYDVLHADVAAVPTALHDRLVMLDGLSNTSGQATIYEVCPALAGARLGVENTAATALLDHPEAFASAKVVADRGAAVQFSDFDAVSQREPACTPESLDALTAGGRTWMKAHGRSEVWEYHLSERGAELHIEIEHGRPPVTRDVVGETLDLKETTLVWTERAIVIIDRARGRLSVHATHAAIKELLRRLVGEHLFGDPGHFRREGVYTLAPLAKGLDAALACDDVPGLKSVTLLAIKVRGVGEVVTRAVDGKGDVRKLRRSKDLYETLADGGVVLACKVRLEFDAHRPIVVELTPSKLTLAELPDDIQRIVDDWLMARGLVVLPEHRRVVELEAREDATATSASATSADDETG